ncbi:hypothetical protein L596_026584 [Steinernema carpocapsae]|uniref:7TM GPCR serpentine receptor class x (Srx) domain-containing protein n=1 Tax=Steinernema carpocapsae TaxID=34508 RepID=A0A4U5M1V6_STECR|nr:hypothetical protein L596_026584 [Steinernema carpocapsae]
MIQIGVLQCCATPMFASVGAVQLLDYDYLNISSHLMKMASTIITIEPILSLALSLDRLKIICGYQFPPLIITVILQCFQPSLFVCTFFLILAYILGALYLLILFTPYASFQTLPGQFLTYFEMKKPYSYLVQKIASSAIIGFSLLNLVVYVIVICYLLKMQLMMTSSSTVPKIAKHEKSILIYALVRFLLDLILTLLYTFVPFEPNPVTFFCIYMGYNVNNLLVPTILHLVINKCVNSLRMTLECRFQDSQKKIL